MRLAMLVQALTVGGLPNYVLDLARALKQSGHTVVVAHGGGTPPAHLDLREVAFLALPDGDAADAARRLRAWAPDVVHVHLSSDLQLLEQLRALGVPLLRSFHDYTSLCMRRGRRRAPGDRCQRALSRSCVFFGCSLGPPVAPQRMPVWLSIDSKLAERQMYQSFDAAIVGSRYMQRTLLHNGFPTERVRLVPYFSRFDATAAETTAPRAPTVGRPGQERPLLLLFSGQAVAGKGLRVLVRALAALTRDGVDPAAWRLTVVSDGPELEPARALARRSGLADRIDFVGWMPHGQLVQHYRDADLLVVPSIWDDPGPLVGLEALALGTPVLGFPVGGIPDYTIDGLTGFLADGVGVGQLATALRRALKGGADLATLGRQGQALVAERHGLQRHVGALDALYYAAARKQLLPA
jgi:glycosyltransferase involved in cell wall biosynthesis